MGLRGRARGSARATEDGGGRRSRNVAVRLYDVRISALARMCVSTLVPKRQVLLPAVHALK